MAHFQAEIFKLQISDIITFALGYDICLPFWKYKRKSPLLLEDLTNDVTLKPLVWCWYIIAVIYIACLNVSLGSLYKMLLLMKINRFQTLWTTFHYLLDVGYNLRFFEIILEACELAFYIDLLVWSLINWWYCVSEVGWFKSEILMHRINKKKLTFHYINGRTYWNTYRSCKLIYKSFLDFIFIVSTCRYLKSRHIEAERLEKLTLIMTLPIQRFDLIWPFNDIHSSISWYFSLFVYF